MPALEPVAEAVAKKPGAFGKAPLTSAVRRRGQAYDAVMLRLERELGEGLPERLIGRLQLLLRRVLRDVRERTTGEEETAWRMIARRLEQRAIGQDRRRVQYSLQLSEA